MPEDAPQFNVARALIPIEADQSAIEQAFTSMERRIDELATKIKSAFDIAPILEQAETRIAELERRVAAIQLPSIPETEKQQPDQRREGDAPAIPFDVDNEMESASKSEETRETNRLLEEIRDALNRMAESPNNE